MRPWLEAHREALPRLTPQEIEGYEKHFELLQQWNQEMNLVSAKSLSQAFAYHYADSLWISDWVYTQENPKRLIDVGTGAGFPGLCFAIRYPQTQVVLYEKSTKKQTFLLAAVANLGLTNVELRGLLEKEKLSSPVVSRAAIHRDEIFRFFETRLTPGTSFYITLGSQTQIQPTRRFQPLAEKTYTLPEGAGDRRIAKFLFK